MTSLRARQALGALGVLGGLYGAWLVLSRQEGLDRLVNLAIWLAGSVVLHDFVLAPAVLALAWGTGRLPTAWRRAGIVAVVVVGSLSVLAIPVLGRFGARSDNPTLLPRSYGGSWLVLVVVTAVLVVVAGVLGTRRERAAGVVGHADAGDAGTDPDPGGRTGGGSGGGSGGADGEGPGRR